MNFMIEIRHVESGLAKTFQSMQEVANFLADKAHAEWEGFQHLGALPLPQAQEPADEPVAIPVTIPSGPVLSPAPDGVFVEGVGLITFEQLRAAGVPIAAAPEQMQQEQQAQADQYQPAAPLAQEPAADAAPASSEPQA